MDPQSHIGLNKLQLRWKNDGEPPVVLRGSAVREFRRQFYFWLAEKLCREKYSKLFNSFFFEIRKGSWQRINDEHFFESLTDWFSLAVWEVLALFIIFLRHPLPSAASVPVNSVWWQSLLFLPSLYFFPSQSMGNFMDTVFPFVMSNCLQEY